MSEEKFYHFDKTQNEYCECLFFNIYSRAKETKYIKFILQSKKNIRSFDSLDDYEHFCEIAYFESFFDMKVNNFISYDYMYNITKTVYNLTSIISHIVFVDYNPEDTYEIVDNVLNNEDKGRKFLRLQDVNTNTPDGYYWTDYPIYNLFDMCCDAFEQKYKKDFCQINNFAANKIEERRLDAKNKQNIE